MEGRALSRPIVETTRRSSLRVLPRSRTVDSPVFGEGLTAAPEEHGALDALREFADAGQELEVAEFGEAEEQEERRTGISASGDEILKALPKAEASSRVLPFNFIVIIEAEAWLMAQPWPLNLISANVSLGPKWTPDGSRRRRRVVPVDEDVGVLERAEVPRAPE